MRSSPDSAEPALNLPLMFAAAPRVVETVCELLCSRGLLDEAMRFYTRHKGALRSRKLVQVRVLWSETFHRC